MASQRIASGRVNWAAAASSLVVSVVGVSAISVDTADAQPLEPPELSTPELHQFISGAIWSVTLHEVAHALINVLSLVATGPEEDVADEFAAMLLLEEALRGVDQAEDIVRANGLAWLIRWQFVRSDVRRGTTYIDDLTYFSEHGLDPQRAAKTLCLLYGALPEQNDEIVSVLFEEELAADPESWAVSRWKERCVREFDRKREVWKHVLAPHASGERIYTYDPDASFEQRAEAMLMGATTFPSSPPEGRPAFQLEFYFDELPQFRYYEFGVLRPTFETALAHVSHRLSIPFDIPVRFVNCPDANAYYYRDLHRIDICHELVDQLAEDFIYFKTGMHYGEWWDTTRDQELDPRVFGAWGKSRLVTSEDQGIGVGTGDGWASIVELASDGGFKKWDYAITDGDLDESSETLVGWGIWGLALDESDPSKGEIWSLDDNGLQRIAGVHQLSDVWFTTKLDGGYERID